MTSTPTVLATTRDGRVLVDASGQPAAAQHPYPAERLVRITHDTWAVRLDDDEAARELSPERGTALAGLRGRLGDRRIAKALALLNNRDQLKFDPSDGSAVSFDEDGRVARGASGRMIFPRTDPAVIGLVSYAGTDEVLIARNVRGKFFSLIAGFVDPGENLEEAFAREVWEETARRVSDIAYWGSQPWPPGGSLMMGFTARTTDRDALAETDGELADTVWVSPTTIVNYPLAPEGSIARDMLNQWFAEQTGKVLESS